jgi:hypothetical protein
MVPGAGSGPKVSHFDSTGWQPRGIPAIPHSWAILAPICDSVAKVQAANLIARVRWRV